jgi:hypothetical protein
MLTSLCKILMFKRHEIAHPFDVRLVQSFPKSWSVDDQWLTKNFKWSGPGRKHDLHGKVFILFLFKKLGYNHWLNFAAIPLKILKIFSLILGLSTDENHGVNDPCSKSFGTCRLVYSPNCRIIPGSKGFHFISFKVNIVSAYVDIKLSDHRLVSSARSLVCGWHDHIQDMGYLQVPCCASSVIPSASR